MAKRYYDPNREDCQNCREHHQEAHTSCPCEHDDCYEYEFCTKLQEYCEELDPHDYSLTNPIIQMGCGGECSKCEFMCLLPDISTDVG